MLSSLFSWLPLSLLQVASSDATNIESSITLDGDHYVINGHKWWTSGYKSFGNCSIMCAIQSDNLTLQDSWDAQSEVIDDQTYLVNWKGLLWPSSAAIMSEDVLCPKPICFPWYICICQHYFGLDLYFKATFSSCLALIFLFICFAYYRWHGSSM